VAEPYASLCVVILGVGIAGAAVSYKIFRVWSGAAAFDLSSGDDSTGNLLIGTTQRREAWQEAAQILKMRWTVRSETDFGMDGTLEGRRVSIDVQLDPTRLRWRAALRAPMRDSSFFAVPSGEAGTLSTGDKDFDAVYAVQAERPEEALAFLAVGIRSRLLRTRATLSHDAITHFTREVPPSAAQGREVARFVRLRAEPFVTFANDLDAAIARTEDAAVVDCDTVQTTR
jgi:hypothetical protein